MTWMRVRFELARSAEFPEGSHRRGYEFILPLDESGAIDRVAFRHAPELCTVQRFWEGSGDLSGTIRHGSHDRWVFVFDDDALDDETLPHFADHLLREGEYVSVRETTGGDHTFKVTLVEPAPGLAAVT
jgi:hypothetical protein